MNRKLKIIIIKFTTKSNFFFIETLLTKIQVSYIYNLICKYYVTLLKNKIYMKFYNLTYSSSLKSELSICFLSFSLPSTVEGVFSL